MAKGGINHEPYHGFVEVIFFAVTFTLLAYFLPILVTILVLIPLGLKTYNKLTAGVCRSYKRLDGKTAIVTGANIGIGLETAKDLAFRGARVILACRNLQKGQIALDEILTETGNRNLTLKHLDLTSISSVRKFCKEILAEEDRLDILVNNAGRSVTKHETTPDGLEVCMQTNHFGPFLLTNLLLDLLRKTGSETGPSRIVVVASNAHMFAWKFDPDNLNAEKSFNAMFVYGLSKMCNIYFTSELNRRLKAESISEITVNSLHPGAVRTGFLDHTQDYWYLTYIVNPVMTFFFKTALEGSQTVSYLAVSEEVEGISGEYYDDCKKTSPMRLARNVQNAGILWKKSVKIVKLDKNETIVAL